MEKLKRYLIMFLSLLVSAAGISLMTRADLGTSCISSVPYVLSLVFKPSMGVFTMCFSLVMVAVQMMILGRSFQPEHALQIPVSILFGWCIDLVMPLFSFVTPSTYLSRLLVTVLGCVIVGISVYMQILADVVMLPSESLIRSIVKRWGLDFGNLKITMDVSMSLLAAVLSLIFLGQLRGVREGTVIASFLVGYVVRFLKRNLKGLPASLFQT